MRSLLSACLLALTIHAAPVPPFRPKPPAAVTAGEWELTWSSTAGVMTLTRDGEYRLQWCGREYLGRWHWETKTRTLHIDETREGDANWERWWVRMRADSLEGEGAYASGWEQTPPNVVAVVVKARRVKP